MRGEVPAADRAGTPAEWLFTRNFTDKKMEGNYVTAFH
jgi:hypothetical protein